MTKHTDAVQICLPTHNGESYLAEALDSLLAQTHRRASVPASALCDKAVIGQRRNHYNTARPHSSLGYRPPAPQAFTPVPPTLDRAAAMQ